MKYKKLAQEKCHSATYFSIFLLVFFYVHYNDNILLGLIAIFSYFNNIQSALHMQKIAVD